MLFKTIEMLDAAVMPEVFGSFSDFMTYDEGVTLTGGFVETAVSTGTISPTAGAANGGWVRLSAAATTDDSGVGIQTIAGHALTPGKRVNLKARAKLGNSTSTNVATESDLFIGLAVTDTSVIAGVTDGVYFLKPDGQTTITCVYMVGSVAVTYTVPAATFTMDTSAHTYGISIIPGTTTSGNDNCTIEWYIDGVNVYRVTGVTLTAATSFMAGTIGFQSGDATGTKFVDVDYLGTAQQR